MERQPLRVQRERLKRRCSELREQIDEAYEEFDEARDLCNERAHAPAPEWREANDRYFETEAALDSLSSELEHVEQHYESVKRRHRRLLKRIRIEEERYERAVRAEQQAAQKLDALVKKA